MVHTPQGKVKAKFIVVAGNAYLNGLVPELAAKSMPCGTQVITTEPLNENWPTACCRRTTAWKTAITCSTTIASPATSA